jgi:hypothetical protein
MVCYYFIWLKDSREAPKTRVLLGRAVWERRGTAVNVQRHSHEDGDFRDGMRSTTGHRTLTLGMEQLMVWCLPFFIYTLLGSFVV